MTNSKQPIDIESLYADELPPKDQQAGITLTEFVEGLKELRRRTKHNDVSEPAGDTEQ